MVELLVTWIPVLMLVIGGLAKLTKNPRIVEQMTPLGVGQHLLLLGVMEIVFGVMLAIPATMNLGFILASCYFAGAIATEFSHNVLKINPFVPMALLWICTFIRDRSIFF